MIGPALEPGASEASDIVQPFQLEIPNLRGRMVRLGPLLDTIIVRHGYPFAVAQLLAEMTTAAVVLASLLKYEGVFTLQAKGEGPVTLLVADVTSAGAVRSYAQFDAGSLPQDRGPLASLPALLGPGYLAFTVDQGEDTERYQGIVALEGETLDDALRHYFQQSEQLDTGLVFATSFIDGLWQTGAIIVQKMPEDEPEALTDSAFADHWRRAMILLSTVRREELLAGSLTPNEVLYRLFHEEEVRVYSPHAVAEGCRCSAERVSRMLATLPPEEVNSLRVDGELIVTCEFCNRSYTL